MRSVGIAAALAACLSLAACAGPGGRAHDDLNARHLLATHSCGGPGELESALITGGDALDRLRASLAGFAQPPVETAAVDFAQEVVLFLSLGRQPTAGYALALPEPPAVRVADGTARLVVQRHEPAPGSLQAQVITCPGLLVAIPRGGYEQVEVVDQSGVPLLSSAVR